MAYRMTARRARALSKAQEASARKRKKRFGFASGRKLSASHKRVIGAVAAGAAVSSAVYGTWFITKGKKAENRKNLAEKANPNGPKRISINQLISDFKAKGDGAVSPSREAGGLVGKIEVRVRAGLPPQVKSVMREIHGTRATRARGNAKPSYKIVEVSDADWNARGLKAREILFSPASAARRERRLDRGLPDYS